MTTSTAHDKDIPTVPGITPEQAEDVPTGDLKGSARRHSRKRVVGVKA